jgi:hypothetical protein
MLRAATGGTNRFRDESVELATPGSMTDQNIAASTAAGPGETVEAAASVAAPLEGQHVADIAGPPGRQQSISEAPPGIHGHTQINAVSRAPASRPRLTSRDDRFIGLSGPFLAPAA